MALTELIVSLVTMIATAAMAVATFLMAKKTHDAVSLQQEELRYAYSPTFICMKMPGSGGWPVIKILNKGRGAAYDVKVSLFVLSYMDRLSKTIITLDNKPGTDMHVDYWPTSPDVGCGHNAQDSQKIETNFLAGHTFGKHGPVGSESEELRAEIVIAYTDHLHQRYQVKLSVIVCAPSRDLSFPEGNVLKLVREEGL